MRVGSLFTGVGGFDLGLERAGHEVVFMCESDESKRRVLRRHWPDVQISSDVCAVRASGRQSGAGNRGRDTRGSTKEKRRSGESTDLPIADGAAVRPEHAGRAASDRRRNVHWGPGSAAGNEADHIPAVDLICGGFPCQDLSVAGRRAGLAGERSGLFHEAARIAGESLRPGGWLLIENVPGLFSSNGGRDFAVVVRTLGDLGFHDLAWRVLDSRHFGVPQRRRRVFVLARRADGDLARKVLLEPEGSSGDFEAGNEARQDDPRTFGVGVTGAIGHGGGRGYRTDLDSHGAYVAATVGTTAGTITKSPSSVASPSEQAALDNHMVPLFPTKDAANWIPRELYHHGGPTMQDVSAGHLIVPNHSATVTAKWSKGSGGYAGDEHHNLVNPIAFLSTSGSMSVDASTESTTTLRVGSGLGIPSPPAIASGATAVRRLTPTECERLQGFPDGWTIPDGPSLREAPIWYELATPDPAPVDPKPDGPRYAAMGDAVTVPVAEWIGRRLMEFGE